MIVHIRQKFQTLNSHQKMVNNSKSGEKCQKIGIFHQKSQIFTFNDAVTTLNRILHNVGTSGAVWDSNLGLGNVRRASELTRITTFEG